MNYGKRKIFIENKSQSMKASQPEMIKHGIIFPKTVLGRKSIGRTL